VCSVRVSWCYDLPRNETLTRKIVLLTLYKRNEIINAERERPEASSCSVFDWTSLFSVNISGSAVSDYPLLEKHIDHAVSHKKIVFNLELPRTQQR
jgi:hypothetical protein